MKITYKYDMVKVTSNMTHEATARRKAEMNDLGERGYRIIFSEPLFIGPDRVSTVFVFEKVVKDGRD